jgi:methylenetetrahydrofolate reductase (NADPH)
VNGNIESNGWVASTERISTEPNRFKDSLLEKKAFIYTLELVPGRRSRGKPQDDILTIAERAAKSKLVHAVSVTDNPGG